MTTPHERIYGQLIALEERLEAIIARDPEQEVQGSAVAALDAVVSEAKDFLGEDDRVASAIAEVVSPEALAAGEPLRASDALIVVSILRGRIGEPPVNIAFV